MECIVSYGKGQEEEDGDRQGYHSIYVSPSRHVHQVGRRDSTCDGKEDAPPGDLGTAIKMVQYFINRAGKKTEELGRAKKLLQKAERRKGR